MDHAGWASRNIPQVEATRQHTRPRVPKFPKLLKKILKEAGPRRRILSVDHTLETGGRKPVFLFPGWWGRSLVSFFCAMASMLLALRHHAHHAYKIECGFRPFAECKLVFVNVQGSALFLTPNPQKPFSSFRKAYSFEIFGLRSLYTCNDFSNALRYMLHTQLLIPTATAIATATTIIPWILLITRLSCHLSNPPSGGSVFR